MLQQRTTKEIKDLIITQLEANFNYKIPLLSKAFTRVLATTLAGVWQINYKVANWIFLQMFVSTASMQSITVFGRTVQPLVEWGRLIGVGDPKYGTQAKLSAMVQTKVIGEMLPAGTQFKSALNGVIYITETSYLLEQATEQIEIVATADFTGTMGNLEEGDKISLVNPLGVIEKTATVLELSSAGVEDETEHAYRSRVSAYFKQRPQGGALADYRIWSSEVPGVLETYWYTGNIPGHVIGYVAGDSVIYPNRVPEETLLQAVGEAVMYEYIDGVRQQTRAPVGAVIDPYGDESYRNIRPIHIKNFHVEIVGLTARDMDTVRNLCKGQIESYFLTLEPWIDGLSLTKTNTEVKQSALIALVQQIVSTNDGSFLTVTLKTASGETLSAWVLEDGQLAQATQVTFIGGV